ncbi:MAG: hypothetical protein LUG24_01130, partial [Clostridiales bacterium]|nr:hypothetical protein [Clostridiales bacterium]
RKKRPPVDEKVEPVRKKRPPADENGQPVRKKRPPAEGERRPVKRKRPPEDYGGETVRRRRKAEDEYYEPVRRKRTSGNGRKKQGARIMDGENKNKKPNNHNREPEEKYENNSSRGCLFPIFLLLVCVIIFVGSFTIFASFMSDHSFNDLLSFIKGEEIVEDDTEETTENSNYIDSNSLLNKAENGLYNTERTGVISQFSLGTNTMKIYDIENKSSVTLSFNNQTELKDENGSEITITKIKEGDTVVFIYDEDRTLLSIQLNPDAEELTSLAVTVNTSRKLITIGNDVFKYNNNTVFRYNGSVLSPSDITEYDIITVKAIDYDAWGVIMEKCHGTLKFTNYENITDAAYSVDEGSFTEIPEDGLLYLTEGVHTITVQSPSISDYTGKFVIKANTEAEINLANVQFLRGSLIVDTAATEAALYVDGVQKSLRNPMFLDYGSHRLTLTKYGESVTKYITIDKEHTETSINF